MAILFFGVKGATLDFRQDLQILDTDAPRIIAHLMQSELGKVTETVETPVKDWEPGKGETEADRPVTRSTVTRQASPQETAANYARKILAELLSQTVTSEKARAAEAAIAAVADIKPVD